MTTIEKDKYYSIEDAIKLAKANCKAKFDATFEAHFNLGIDNKKPDQSIRVSTTLPNGTGKQVKVAVFASKKIKDADLELTEEDLVKIEKNEIRPKVDFDVLVAEPKYMPKLAKVAKILGPAGVMPSPKSGTVTDDIEKAVHSLKQGKIEIRNEANAPIIHVIFGKKSFEDDKLVENFNEILSTIKSNRPQKVRPEVYVKSCFISTTMGASVKIAIAN